MTLRKIGRAERFVQDINQGCIPCYEYCTVGVFATHSNFKTNQRLARAWGTGQKDDVICPSVERSINMLANLLDTCVNCFFGRRVLLNGNNIVIAIQRKCCVQN